MRLSHGGKDDLEVCVGWSDVGVSEWEGAVGGGKRLVLVATVFLDETGYFPVQIWRGTGVGCVNIHERCLLSFALPMDEDIDSVRKSYCLNESVGDVYVADVISTEIPIFLK